MYTFPEDGQGASVLVSAATCVWLMNIGASFQYLGMVGKDRSSFFPEVSLAGPFLVKKCQRT